MYDYDLFTIGAGSGGVAATRRAGAYGARAAICEEDRAGGTCVLRGCIPKKLLIYGAHYADHFEDAVNYGWTIESAHHDWRTLIDNKNTELDRLNGIYLSILKNNDVDLHEGRGVLSDAHTVEVNGKSITAENILVAVGGWPSTPDIPGIEHVISSNEALELPALPKRMVIVGGGYVAVEFAGIFASLGTQVTEIVRADNVLRGFDEDIRAALGTELGNHGIDLITGGVGDSITKNGAEFNLCLRGGRAYSEWVLSVYEEQAAPVLLDAEPDDETDQTFFVLLAHAVSQDSVGEFDPHILRERLAAGAADLPEQIARER